MPSDLLTSLSVPLARPLVDDDELAAVVEVLQSGQLCQGAATEQFETAFAAVIGARHAVAVSSGSAALLVAMQALGVGRGDEVIVPDITFVSTATAAMYLGARPVFCDIGWDDYCVDAGGIAALITPRTRLIVPVHFGGRVADMNAIRDVAAAHGIRILEDAAAAHLSKHNGRCAGTLGDAAIFSFTPTKMMTTGEGGMITTSDDDLAARCRLIRNFGDGDKFAWNSLGFNFRMTAISAALGLAQLERLPVQIEQRRQIAARYAAAFTATSEITTPPPGRHKSTTNHQLYPVLLDVDALGVSRDTVIDELARRGVASRLYYPALHRMGVFASQSPPPDENLRVAVEYERRALCLPIFAGLTAAEQDHVIASLLEIISFCRHRFG